VHFQRFLDDPTHKGPEEEEGLARAYDYILEKTRSGLYSDEIRKQAFGLVFPRIATEDTAHPINALTRCSHHEVQVFVTELIAMLPSEWLIKDLRPSRQAMHMDLWHTSYLAFVEPGRIATSFVTFFRELVQSHPPFGQVILQAGFFDILADFAERSYRLPRVSVPYSPRYGDPKHLQDVCKSTMKIFETCNY